MAIAYGVGDASAPGVHGPKIIVHVCNDVGGWGRGFVVALSNRWPEPEQHYRKWFRGKTAQPFALGEVQFVKVSADTSVANLIGQRDIRTRAGVPPIRYDALRQGLRVIAVEVHRLAASVHMPRIGCGLAGGSWEQVGPIVEQELAVKGISVTVYDLPD